MEVNAVTRNLIANHGKFQWLLSTLAHNGDVDSGSLGAFEQIGYVAGAHVVSRLSIDGDDNVPGANAGAIRRRAHKGRDDDHLVVTGPDCHAHAVILATLIFAQQRVGFGVEKVRVRIEHVEHAGNGAVVDGFVRVYRLGIVLLNEAVDVGEG